MQDIMNQFGTAKAPLYEIEVLTGTMIGYAQTTLSSRARERTRTIKEHYNEMALFIIKRIRKGEYEPITDEDRDETEGGVTIELGPPTEGALERSLAC